MAELVLEGNTLGEKHQQYNIIVHDVIASQKTVNTENFNSENDDSDLVNLLNIDIASHNKDINYFLKVLTCEDMLYVSRAIKQSNWLINDESYAHIIHPNYLSTNIFPHMCSKAKYKLIKHIRNNLKDEKRAEEFYTHEENPKEAVKWLPGCSLKFIENNLIYHVKHIKMTLLRRLCEKSITALEIYVKNSNTGEEGKALQANMFLLPSNTEKYLDLVEAINSYYFPTFNKRATKVIMKKNSNRIIDKFEIYYKMIDLQTFIKYLKPENIKDFLIRQAQKIEGSLYRYFNFERLILYIKLMPQEVRFEFVKEVFIDKKHESKEKYLLSEKETKGMSNLYEITSRIPFNDGHIWYQFAPFDVALQKIKELIGTATNIRHKISLFEVLLTSAQRNITHQRAFLEYFRNINTESRVKQQILKKVLTENNFLKYNSETWVVINDIFESMDIYTESENIEYITEAIISYKVVHEEKVPEIVENKFNFNSLVRYHKYLTETQKTMVFNYLYSLITDKIFKCNTESEKGFTEKINTLEQALNLLKDFKQDLERYPALICIIKDLIKIKYDSSWNVSMEVLFNVKKTWRKLFFEQSLALCPTESNLLNALKHGPHLLEQNKNVVQNMLCNDKLSLNRFLSKIKIYWTNSLTENITLKYTEKLSFVGDHNATTRGLSILLPRRNLKKLLEHYAPKEAKIDWSKIDEIELSVQQQFAKNMHRARPQPHPEAILWYAKGDYLRIQNGNGRTIT
ncbi:uncharacterized protein [Epargyreus clarus]|uniref:uncharacterized protein isoform X3 n=1 Tax=Epargyreus clarus TaxID=520877 RepID=UPI003C2BA641